MELATVWRRKEDRQPFKILGNEPAWPRASERKHAQRREGSCLLGTFPPARVSGGVGAGGRGAHRPGSGTLGVQIRHYSRQTRKFWGNGAARSDENWPSTAHRPLQGIGTWAHEGEVSQWLVESSQARYPSGFRGPCVQVPTAIETLLDVPGSSRANGSGALSRFLSARAIISLVMSSFPRRIVPISALNWPDDMEGSDADGTGS